MAISHINAKPETHGSYSYPFTAHKQAAGSREMKRSSTSTSSPTTSSASAGAGTTTAAAATERPGLLTLPPELWIHQYLDGGGIGGTCDLFALSCAHRNLAHFAALATRLDVRTLRLPHGHG